LPEISYANVAAAAQCLAGVAHRTPVLTSRQADERAGAQVYFKCEKLPARGRLQVPRRLSHAESLLGRTKIGWRGGLSSGNHAQAVALAAHLLGMSATIVMPRDAPPVKRAATEGYGASIIPYEREREDREAIARRVVAERGATLVVPFDNADVIAGQGTVAKELLEETGPLDFLFVCVGGGGLLAGCALAARELSPGCQVYGVEPEAGNDAQQSLRSGASCASRCRGPSADGAQTPASAI